jgi:hypothetical protein
MIPGQSRAAIHFLSPDGTYQGHSDFATGWRIDIVDAALVDNELVGALVIEIKTGPSIHGAPIGRQVYGIFPGRVALLRIEDLDGKLETNGYGRPEPAFGPAPPPRSPEEWEALLVSSDRTKILEALTWIAGYHRLPQDLQDSAEREEKEAARVIEAVRKSATVQKRIAELATSENQWLREAARLAQDTLAKQASR